MRLLLDTHCWLWMQTAPERFSPQALELLGDSHNELLLSAASAWEIAIKFALGKLPLPAPPQDYVPSRMLTSGTKGLPIQHSHALAVAALPPHHADPFDRLLIVQARLERIPIMTIDPQFRRYEVELLDG